MMPREQHTKLALRIQLRFEKYEPSENREVKKRKIDLKDKFLVFSWLANKMWFLINFIKIDLLSQYRFAKIFICIQLNLIFN
jgi:hypothetical protein